MNEELLERLAEAAHDTFCDAMRAQGYVWGPRTDAQRRTHSSLKAYAQLTEDEKEQNRGTVRDIPAKLASAGYIMVPARGDEPPFSFPGDELEQLAQQEHVRWVRAKLQAGWQYARKTDKADKRHHSLVPWRQVSREELERHYSASEVEALGPGELAEEEREKDRVMVRGIPAILARAGFTVAKGRANSTPAARSRPNR